MMTQSTVIKVFAFMMGMVVIVALVRTITPPTPYPIGSVVEIEEGTGLLDLANELKKANVIRSPFWFRVGSIVLGGERLMKAGQYYMERPESPFLIAWRILHGRYNIETVKVTVPEGFTVMKISNLFDERFPFFDNPSFEKFATEGYLFPDTYFLPVTISASSTIKIMRDNFIRRIFPVMPDIEASGKTLEEIITMASIIEAEANNQKDREIVSGILWKRMRNGMPLQVDATFVYVNGKTTAELTADDLKIDSPFNTYINLGLPPHPISNPGINSIQAALYPTTTPFFYFLTGDDGNMYYSRTFEEHVTQKQKHIR